MQAAQTRRREDSRGNGRLGLIVAVIIVALIGHVLIKVMPVRIAKAEYADIIEDTAREFALGNLTYDQVIEELVADAGRRGLEVSEESITVDSESKKEISITVDYDVVLDMVWGEWVQSYSITKVNPKF